MKPYLYEQTVSENKKETRRLHGLKEINEAPDDWQLDKVEIIKDRFYAYFSHKNRTTSTIRMIPAKYRLGEVLYLAETHYLRTEVPDNSFKSQILYGDDPIVSHMKEWEPERFSKLYDKISPMFLKQIHGREFVKMHDISIERIQNITEEGAQREGVTDLNYGIGGVTQYRASFQSVWEDINKKMPWALNPWVFVYKYNYLKEKSRRAWSQ